MSTRQRKRLGHNSRHAEFNSQLVYCKPRPFGGVNPPFDPLCEKKPLAFAVHLAACTSLYSLAGATTWKNRIRGHRCHLPATIHGFLSSIDWLIDGHRDVFSFLSFILFSFSHHFFPLCLHWARLFISQIRLIDELSSTLFLLFQLLSALCKALQRAIIQFDPRILSRELSVQWHQLPQGGPSVHGRRLPRTTVPCNGQRGKNNRANHATSRRNPLGGHWQSELPSADDPNGTRIIWYL